MEQPQDLRFSFSLSFLDRIRLAAVLMSQRPMFLVFGLIWLVLGVSLALFALTTSLPLAGGLWRLLAVCVVLLPTLMLLGAASALLIRREPNEPYQYIADRAGLHLFTSAFQHSLPWPSILRIRRAGGFLLFYFSARHAHCIPLRALSAPGLEPALLALAQANGAGARRG